MLVKSKIKLFALGGLVLSFLSLIVHLLLAKYSSADLVRYSAITGFSEDLNVNIEGIQGSGYSKLWKNVVSLESLQPYANPRSVYPGPTVENNGFIYAKIFGGFEKIRSSICDLVTISRLLNATLVLPEIQESTHGKGISSKFNSFSYLYNEDQFLAGLVNDIAIVKGLPPKFNELRKLKQFPTFNPKSSASPTFYIKEVLPKLKEAKVVGLVLHDGGCLQSLLPSKLAEYQRLRCRVAFHALHFRPEILALGHLMVERLRALGQPYLAFNPGLVRDTLAYHGCAELFQDVHTELIKYRRKQMIKRGVVKEELNVDSHVRKANGSCPLMPEEKNASSGMGVADHSKSTYLELQRKKLHRYVIFKIDEKKKEVLVEKTGDPAESYDDFTAALPENDCRYAVYDYDFVTSENCQKSKIFFFAWSPSVSRIRAKMLYATSKERFRRELEGIHYEIQATDPTEMDLEVIQDRAN